MTTIENMIAVCGPVDAGKSSLIGVLTSVVGAFYYLRIIKIMYFEENEVKLDIIDNKSSMLILGLMIVIIVLFGIFLNWLIEITMGISSLI